MRHTFAFIAAVWSSPTTSSLATYTPYVAVSVRFSPASRPSCTGFFSPGCPLALPLPASSGFLTHESSSAERSARWRRRIVFEPLNSTPAPAALTAGITATRRLASFTAFYKLLRVVCAGVVGVGVGLLLSTSSVTSIHASLTPTILSRASLLKILFESAS